MQISANCMVCGNSFSFVLNFPQELHQKFCPRCMARYPLLSLYPAPFQVQPHEVQNKIDSHHSHSTISSDSPTSPISPVSLTDSSDSKNTSSPLREVELRRHRKNHQVPIEVIK